MIAYILLSHLVEAQTIDAGLHFFDDQRQSTCQYFPALANEFYLLRGFYFDCHFLLIAGFRK